MIEGKRACPECGAVREAGVTCQDHFHQMLFWEAEDPQRGEVHHIMVLCYHLQHPSLYSPEGLETGKRLLADFLIGNVTPEEARRRNRAQFDSWERTWKIKGTPERHGAYEPPVHWTMTAASVAAGGPDEYCERVRQWAKSVYEAHQEGGLL